VKRLRVHGETEQANNKMRRRIPGNAGDGGGSSSGGRQKIAGKIANSTGNPETVLEGFGAAVHLICADIKSDLEVVLAADQVERVFKREDVCTTLERREAAIANGPVAGYKQGTDQDATICARRALGAAAEAGAAQVRARNVELRRLATTST